MCCTDRYVWGVIPAQALQKDLICVFCLDLQGKMQVMHEATAESTSVDCPVKGVSAALGSPRGDEAGVPLQW